MVNALIKSRPYRGRYPTRICEVSSANGRTLCRTNDGKLYLAMPAYGAARHARMPELGDDIAHEPTWIAKACTLSAWVA